MSTYPQRPHHGRSSAYPSVVSRPLAPSHVEAYRSSVKVVHTGESEGTNWRYGHLVSSMTPVPFASSFRE